MLLLCTSLKKVGFKIEFSALRRGILNEIKLLKQMYSVFYGFSLCNKALGFFPQIVFLLPDSISFRIFFCNVRGGGGGSCT